MPVCDVTEDIPAEAVQEAAHPPAAADGEHGEGMHLSLCDAESTGCNPPSLTLWLCRRARACS